MNKSELVKRIASECDTTNAAAERSLNATLDAITDELKNGNDIALIGFGTFSVKSRAARMGRNPKTGEEIKIAATKVPSFKAGAGLKKAVQ